MHNLKIALFAPKSGPILVKQLIEQNDSSILEIDSSQFGGCNKIIYCLCTCTRSASNFPFPSITAYAPEDENFKNIKAFLRWITKACKRRV